ncbi:MAG: DNA topoisomerase IV [Micrococcales bacterium]|nr:MAG: DNA topoisomerase IV [Micrococcales bacterium]
MARRSSSSASAAEEHILDIDVSAEMRDSFLEYAYSVIYSRALPDARDGLKPVQRRILYAMSEMGMRPDRGHAKSARIVGEVMGKFHPHGDAAIYDALVRMAQPFTLRVPLVDGHGNFGSLDNGPAQPRYTEARLAPAALLMTGSLDEDVVDLVPTYDNQLTQPEVLPAAFPNLLVNGSSGIAVGMATNMVSHNLKEVIDAARHLLKHPNAGLDTLMRYVPGPDLPGGGRIIGLDGIRAAYRTGRGTFRTRATVSIENVTPRLKGIVVTELPPGIGVERVTERIKDAVESKRLTGVSDVIDLTDRAHGLRLVIKVKSGFNPDAVLAQLYRLTPMEDSFGINNVCLVGGQPQTLGLKDLLTVYLDHRIEVVRRRTRYRLDQRTERLHLVEGLLIAIADIDEVIAVIRSSEDSAAARTRLMTVFDLSQQQAEYILELRLRRLTKYSRLELEAEQGELQADIATLSGILADEDALRSLVSDELAEVARVHASPRRTVLLEADATTVNSGAPLEIADDPCVVLLSGTGLIARTGADVAEGGTEVGQRRAHDVITHAVPTTARAEIGALTDTGRVLRVRVVDTAVLPPTAGTPSLSGAMPVSELVDLGKQESVIGLCRIDGDAPPVALGTAAGVVKRVRIDAPKADAWEVISLKAGDRVVGAAAAGEADDLVFVTSDAHLLRFAAALVRPQGQPAAGMAGVRVAAKQSVVSFTVVPAGVPAEVVSIAGSSAGLPGTQPGSAKVTPLPQFPAKGRGTGGVRCHRFGREQDALIAAWAGPAPAIAVTAGGKAVALPAATDRRDGSGQPLSQPVAAVGGPVAGILAAQADPGLTSGLAHP